MVLKFGNNKLNINNSIGFIAIIAIYRFLLDKCYINIISPLFAYDGLKDHHTFTLLIISWVVLITSLLFFRGIAIDKKNRISNIIVTTIYMLSFVPFTTCIYVGILDNGFIVYNFVYWIILLVFQSYFNKRPVDYFNRITFGKLELNDNAVMFIGVFSLLLVIFISAVYTHFRLNFNLFLVYELRAEALTFKLPTVLVYAFSWTRAINPILLGYCIENKKKIAALLFIIAQLLSFGIDGLKSTFFMIILVVLCVLICRAVNISNIKLYTVMGITIITALTIVEKALVKTEFIATLFTRRMMFVPNYLSQCYYDFFKSNPYDFFRGSFLRYLGISSPYDSDGGITMAIGKRYFQFGTNCNDGLVADAMTNMGLPGMVLMPIIVCLVLRLLDKSTLNINNCIMLISALYIAEILVGTFLATALITHGILIIIFITAIMNRDEKRLRE